MNHVSVYNVYTRICEIKCISASQVPICMHSTSSKELQNSMRKDKAKTSLSLIVMMITSILHIYSLNFFQKDGCKRREKGTEGGGGWIKYLGYYVINLFFFRYTHTHTKCAYGQTQRLRENARKQPSLTTVYDTSFFVYTCLRSRQSTQHLFGVTTKHAS